MPSAITSGEHNHPRIVRVERAYCLEIGRVVSIDEARELFVNRDDIGAFHFECAEPGCAELGVRIAGVNYRFAAADAVKFVSNHFRRLDDHAPGCPYYVAATESVEEVPGTEASTRKRQPLRRDLVDQFVPPITLGPLRMPKDVLVGEIHGNPAHPRRAPSSRRSSTNSLSRLVDTYRALISSQEPNAARRHIFRIRGLGVMPAAQFFVPIYRARPEAGFRVYFGGARLLKDYGAGFKLRFFDRAMSMPTFLYVGSAVASDAPGWAEPLAELHAGRYCTAYALAQLGRRDGRRGLSIEIEDASQLVLRMPVRRGLTGALPSLCASSPIDYDAR